jgi:hypothetical protein
MPWSYFFVLLLYRRSCCCRVKSNRGGNQRKAQKTVPIGARGHTQTLLKQRSRTRIQIEPAASCSECIYRFWPHAVVCQPAVTAPMLVSLPVVRDAFYRSDMRTRAEGAIEGYKGQGRSSTSNSCQGRARYCAVLARPARPLICSIAPCREKLVFRALSRIIKADESGQEWKQSHQRPDQGPTFGDCGGSNPSAEGDDA